MKEEKEEEAMALVALIANLLAKVSILLYPVMPKTSLKIATVFGFDINNMTYKKYIENNELLDEIILKKIPPLFPKIEKMLMASPEPIVESKKEKEKIKDDGIITIEQFFQTKLKIGTVIEAKEIEGSDKLLILQVDLNEEKPRQIVAGIKQFYSPENLLNTQVCIVSNLKPARIFSKKSEGMLLAAKDKGTLTLIRPEKDVSNGSFVG